jgi:hypothetical protein
MPMRFFICLFIFKAVALDNIIPNLEYFAYTNRNGDPIRGYWLSFFIAFACNMIGNLNAGAPLITMFFLVIFFFFNNFFVQTKISFSSRSKVLFFSIKQAVISLATQLVVSRKVYRKMFFFQFLGSLIDKQIVFFFVLRIRKKCFGTRKKFHTDAVY